MPKFIAAVSALATMTGRFEVEAATPAEAAKIAKSKLQTGDYDPDWEFVDNGRPAPGSAAVDAIRDEDDEDDIFIVPADPATSEVSYWLAAASLMTDALKKIDGNGPVTEPDAEDYDDTESAYGNGMDVAGYEAAKVARDALASLPGLVDNLDRGQRAALALKHLTAARELFKSAGASPRLLDKIRLAISSGKGAVRYAEHKDMADYAEQRRVEEESDREFILAAKG